MSTTTSSSKISLFDLFSAVEAGTITPEIQMRASEEKAKIIADREKAAEKRAEKAKVNDPLKKQAMDFLAKGKNWASAVGVEIGVSTSKASYLLRDLETDGYLTSTLDKAPGSKSKSKCYTIVPGKTFVPCETDEAETSAEVSEE